MAKQQLGLQGSLPLNPLNTYDHYFPGLGHAASILDTQVSFDRDRNRDLRHDDKRRRDVIDYRSPRDKRDDVSLTTSYMDRYVSGGAEPRHQMRDDESRTDRQHTNRDAPEQRYSDRHVLDRDRHHDRNMHRTDERRDRYIPEPQRPTHTPDRSADRYVPPPPPSPSIQKFERGERYAPPNTPGRTMVHHDLRDRVDHYAPAERSTTTTITTTRTSDLRNPPSVDHYDGTRAYATRSTPPKNNRQIDYGRNTRAVDHYESTWKKPEFNKY